MDALRKSILPCGKGETILRGEDISSHEHHHKENLPHGGKHHGYRRPEFPEGRLADLMAKCGHRLFHGGDASMFSVLTAEEQAYLKNLLAKLLE